MEPLKIRQSSLLGTTRSVDLRDGIARMAFKRFGFAEVIETHIEHIDPIAIRVQHSAPKLLLFGFGLLVAAPALVLLALRINEFESGAVFVLMAVVFGVLGEQMLEKYFNTKANFVVFLNKLTGGSAVVLIPDRPSKEEFDRFIRGLKSRIVSNHTESGVVGFGEVIEELKVAKQMLDEGLITEQDYEHKKNTALKLEPSGQVQLH